MSRGQKGGRAFTPASMGRGLLMNRSTRCNAVGDGAVPLRGFLRDRERALIELATEVAARAPFRHPSTPSGIPMSVAITNCSRFGWYSDAEDGYRCVERDPPTGLAWPAMPELFREVALECARAGGYENFDPQAGLINRSAPGAKLSLHRDEDEEDLSAPIVSISWACEPSFSGAVFEGGSVAALRADERGCSGLRWPIAPRVSRRRADRT